MTTPRGWIGRRKLLPEWRHLVRSLTAYVHADLMPYMYPIGLQYYNIMLTYGCLVGCTHLWLFTIIIVHLLQRLERLERLEAAVTRVDALRSGSTHLCLPHPAPSVTTARTLSLHLTPHPVRPQLPWLRPSPPPHPAPSVTTATTPLPPPHPAPSVTTATTATIPSPSIQSVTTATTPTVKGKTSAIKGIVPLYIQLINPDAPTL